MREIVLDTETTGFEPSEGDRIVEIGAVELFNHLPTGRSYSRMRDLVRLYIGHELAWQVRLVLRHSEVPYAWLGNSVWLGWSSWLGVRIEETDARDLDLVVRDFHLDHGGTPVSHQAGRNHAAARV